MKAQLGVRMAALSAAATLVLSACGGAHPGAAVELDGYRVSMETVDAQAAGLCAVGASVLFSGLSEGDRIERQTYRQVVADTQVRLRLAELGAEELGLDVPEPDVSLDDLQVPVDGLDEQEQQGLLEFFADTAHARALLGGISEQLAGDVAEGEDPNQVVNDFLFDQVDDIDVDPRIGLADDLQEGPASGSLSVATSEGAELPDASDPDLQTALAELPASLTCD